MESLLQDVRYAVRGLRRSPGFTLIAVATLACSIGANAAIFSVFNSVLLRPLDYPDAERLVRVHESNPRRGFVGSNVTGPVFAAWRERQRSFSGLGAVVPQNGVINGLGEPQELPVGIASPELFAVLGLRPIIGRTFSAEEHLQNGPAAVLISRGFWIRQFGGDSSVLGRPLILNDLPRPIIGVMPDGGEWTRETQVWAALPPSILPQLGPGNHMLTVVGRLRDGATLEGATADLAAISEQVLATYPEGSRGWQPDPTYLAGSMVSSSSRTTVLTLFGAVGFVLLIACANLANLTLVRAASRRREVVLRAALGAGRWRLTRALIAESAVLAILGAGLGLLVGVWGIGAIRGLAEASLPRLEAVRMNLPVLAFTAAITTLATVLFGLVPAIGGSRADLQTALREGDARVSRHGIGRDVLAVTEIALALVLTAGAGLLVQSLSKLHRQPLGYAPAGVIALDLDLPSRRFEKPESRLGVIQQIEDRIRSLPGVAGVGSTRALPLESGGPDTEFAIEGRAPDANGQGWAFFTPVSPRYLATMNATLAAGRHLTDADNVAGAPLVAVINETLARKHWPGASPLGGRMKMGKWSVEIVGVVRDLRQRFLRDPIRPQMFVPYALDPTLSVSMIVRATGGDPVALVPAIHEAVWAVDARLPLEEWTMQSLMNDATAESRFGTVLLSAFAGLAILLAVIGVYGVVSFGVAERRREIGVRMALGAERGRVLGMVLRRSATIAAVGVVIGAAGVVALGRVFRRLLFEVQPTDPLTLVGSAAIVGLVILAAAAVPARRAAGVDPLVALRSD